MAILIFLILEKESYLQLRATGKMQKGLGYGIVVNNQNLRPPPPVGNPRDLSVESDAGQARMQANLIKNKFRG